MNQWLYTLRPKENPIKFNFCCYHVQISLIMSQQKQRDIFHTEIITDMFQLQETLPVLSSFMTYHRVCNQINTTGVTSGTGTAHPYGVPEFTLGFSGVRVTRSLVLYVCFVDRCLSFCTFSFDHCVVCSSIYGF